MFRFAMSWVGLGHSVDGLLVWVGSPKMDPRTTLIWLLRGGGSNNTQHKGQIYIGCPSRGYISKTKQDRHKVTMEHCIEVCITDSVAALKFS